MTLQPRSDRAPLAEMALPVDPRVRAARAELAGELTPESIQPLDWARFRSATRRYRWWVLALTGVGILGGILAGRLLPPRYQVQATIWIQSSEPRGTGRGPIGANQLFESYAWVDLLKSYVVLDQVARDLKLYLTPERGANGAFAGFEVGDTYRPGRYRIVADRTGRSFSLLGAKGEELQQGAIGDSIGAALGFRWAPAAAALHAGSDLTFTVRPLRDAARKLANSLAGALSQRLQEGGESAGSQQIALETSVRAHLRKSEEASKAREHELEEIHEAVVQLATGQQLLADNLAAWRAESGGDTAIVSNRLQQLEHTALDLLDRLNGEVQARRHEHHEDETRRGNGFKRWLYGTGSVFAALRRDETASIRRTPDPARSEKKS